MRIESERLLFRTVTRPDLDRLFQWRGSRDAKGPFEVLPPVSWPDLEREFESNGLVSDAMTTLIIEERTAARPIGIVQYRLINPYNLNYQDGVHIFEVEQRGKGFGLEAQQLIANYLFSNTHTNRIQSKCDVENAASRRMHEKSAFKLEGILREEAYYGGEFHDYCLYSILRSDWLEADFRRVL